VTDGDDKSENARREAEALLGPGSVGEVVRNFKRALKEKNFGVATSYLSPELAEHDMSGLDLGFLDQPGWGVSGRPRVIGPDSEIVLYIRTGRDTLQRVDKAKPVEAFPFTVSHSPEGPRISQIGPDDWLMARLGY
jgi:hypothetical protein